MLKILKQLYRLVTIRRVMLRYGIDRILLKSAFVRRFSITWFLLFDLFHWRHKSVYKRGEAIRIAMEELGPIFVKFGQMLSTRPDLLPEDIVVELTFLQDRVPPFSPEQAITILENTYQQPVGQVFEYFHHEPMASASIAQVHAATLHDGTAVIVKILRPQVKEAIVRDVDLLYAIANFLERHWEDGKRLRLRDVVAEFERTLFDELDLTREAANASQLRRNFEGASVLYVPQIYWKYTHENILVQERIYGIPISDIDALRACGVNLKKLAERGVEIFFTQVFRDCFFHADMHPGNVFVSQGKPDDPHYIAVDFGIMGSLNKSDQHYLAENFLAFFRRDYRRVAELHVESGWVPLETRVDEFEAAIRTVCEPIFERPLRDIYYGQLLLRLFQTGRRFNMEVQPQLVLLQKTLIAVEGLGRQLYPELDLWKTAKPFLEQWLRRRISFPALLRRLKTGFPYWADKIPDLPMLTLETLEMVHQKHLRRLALRPEDKPRKIPSIAPLRWGIINVLLLLTGIWLGLHWQAIFG